jgi:hypothetical protein
LIKSRQTLHFPVDWQQRFQQHGVFDSRSWRAVVGLDLG